MIKLIIAGSRTYNNYPEFEKSMEKYTGHISEDVIVLCGEAKGVDTMGKMYGVERGWKIESYPVTKEEWNTIGKSAGYLRNKKMAENATHCICFWDGESKGTGHMIELAKQYKLNLRIVKV